MAAESFRWRSLAGWLAVMALVCAAAVCVHFSHLRHQKLLRDFVAAQRRLGSRNALAKDRAALAARVGALRGEKQSHANQHLVEQLRRQLNRELLQMHNLEVMLAQSDGGDRKQIEPVWPDGAAVLRAEDWAYRGTDSPADVLQSVLWAATNGDTDKLASAIGFEPGVRAAAESWFQGLPAATQSQYGSVEKVVATMIAGAMPTDYQAAAITQDGGQAGPAGDVTLLHLRVEQDSGQQADFSFKTERSADGWRLDVPRPVLTRFERQLASP